MQDWMFIPVIIVIGAILVFGFAGTWRIATGRANRKHDQPATEQAPTKKV